MLQNTESPLSEDAIISGIMAQDPSVLPEFYARYQDRIMSIAMPLVQNRWDAEEVVQDVVWQVFHKGNTFRGDSHFWRWIRVITRNASLMLLQKRKRVPTPLDGETLIHLLDNTPHSADIDMPDKAMELGQATERIQVAFESLKKDNRRIYWATDIEGLPMQHTADSLGMSLLAFKARLFRIRRTLRSAFSEEPTHASLS